ncbi:MAG: iron-sulfur cluster carrier protein MrpORP [Planctomycetota bacterium]
MSSHATRTDGPDRSRRELQTQQIETRMERIGRKIIVLSGKGGVGKSTVAANLAVALGRTGRKVGLLDVDLHGPSVPTLLGLAGRRLEATPAGGMAPIAAGENLSVVSIGLLLAGEADPVIWRGPMKFNVIRQFLGEVEWGELDDLIIDAPPGTGDEPLSVAQMVGAGAWAVLVTTPQAVAVADVRRSVSFCRALDLPVAGIIENMSGLVCPHCGRAVNLFATGGGERLAAEMEVPFLGRIPLDGRIAASGDAGTPVARDAEDPSGKAFGRVTEALTAQMEGSAVAQAADSRQNEESRPMKMAIPIVQGRLSLHFGHCEQFALVDVDTDNRSVTGVDYVTPPAHEPGVLPRWLGEQGADVIITGGMGQRAQGLFARQGITVVVGAPVDTPEAVAAAYLDGTLEAGENICDH